ncbi:MAG: hypothetical protein RQ761_05575 [Bacteroidales bacterium]|nr:hypothetical protein [Bacteroidales bacterium]
MLKDNLEFAEMIATTMFKIEALKETLWVKRNRDLINYLDCYNRLSCMLRQAAKSDNPQLLSDLISREINYINELIDYSEMGDHFAGNIAAAEEILKDIRLRMQLIEKEANKEQDN